MKKIKTLLLVSFASVTVSLGALAVGCGGDDTNPANGTDGGGTDATNGTDTSVPSTDANTGSDVVTPTDAAVPLQTGQIDRMGRPAINTALITATDKKAYNAATTFADPPAFVATDFDPHLKTIDLLDTVDNWTPDGGTHPLVGPLGGAPGTYDILVVNPNVECPDRGSYLDLEFMLLGFYGVNSDGGPTAPAQTCGGRTPNDDVMDHSLSLLVTEQANWTPTANALKGGDAGPDPVQDCVNAATKPADIGTWPYLQGAN